MVCKPCRHPSDKIGTIRRLKVFHLCILVVGCSSDDDGDFNLIQTSLIQQLRTILDQYPDDGQILKVKKAHTQAHSYIYKYLYVYIHIYVYIYIYMYIYIHIYVYIYIYIHIHHIYMQLVIYTYMYIYIYTRLQKCCNLKKIHEILKKCKMVSVFT